VQVLRATLLAVVALVAPASAHAAATDRYNPVAPSELILAHARMKPAQGGQRVRVTIPLSAGRDGYGDTIAYRWNTRVDGGPRCQPGELPSLGNVAAGTVIDAPLPQPAKGWCRGSYGVDLEARVTLASFDCEHDPFPGCDGRGTVVQRVASAAFQVGSDPRPICQDRGDARRCWNPPTYRSPASWIVTAPLSDLLGPDGATEDADAYFMRAFRRDAALRDRWETDDNTFYGWPRSRGEALRMTTIVDRVLRSGRYYHQR
jgi:hypothetical protein